MPPSRNIIRMHIHSGLQGASDLDRMMVSFRAFERRMGRFYVQWIEVVGELVYTEFQSGR